MNGRPTLLWTIGGTTAVLFALVITPQLRLVYNASDSAPRGFYVVHRGAQFRVGDYVVARLPEDTARLAAARGYLPRSVPVLKRIAASGGQQVCLRHGTVYIDDKPTARVLHADGNHRPLSAWKHCRRLGPDELFLLNAYSLSSFDSRYFGPLDVSFVRGRAVALWTFGVQ